MKIGNLVRALSTPLGPSTEPVPAGHLCVIKEFKGDCIVVEDPRGRILTFKMTDIEVVDY